MKPTHRFLLVILPSKAVAGEVLRLRDDLFARIGNFSGRRVVPHITLFFADLGIEASEALMEAIAEGASDQGAFPLRYDGIVHFPDRRTIYIEPVEKQAIDQVRTAIVRTLSKMEMLRDHIRETDHPHLTIAAGLNPDQFEMAWSMLAPHRFAADHAVNELVLLKRELRPGAEYAEVRPFKL